ncbi:MAG: hypothetical protein LAO20_20095 [Acidobacteriia bacterium]|nr:hypothetical protein [Terriglobia bacterium]
MPIPVFLLVLGHPGSARAIQNPAAQAAQAEQARRMGEELEARRRTQRMMQHQFREVNELTFPKGFGSVWYRVEKLTPSVTGALFGKEYQASGELILEKDALTFKAGKENLRIDYAQIESLDYRLLSTQRHSSPYPVDWAIVSFRMPDGTIQVALFHDGRHSGKGEDTDLIFGSIRWALNSVRLEQEAKLAPLDRLARQVERLEAARDRQNAVVTEQEFKETLEQASKEVRAFLDAHPDDMDANILLVRLARLQDLQGVDVVGGKNAEEELAQTAKEKRARLDELMARLDHALALQPNRADAYYWKARMYGVRHAAIRNGRFTRVSIDLQEAIRNSRRATELAPDNVPYREALAQYLILGEKYDDAADVMRSAAGGQHIISLLLADRKALPVPDKAVSSPMGAAGFAEMVMERGRIQDYLELRVQEFIINAPASDVTEFYQKRWPGFQFFEPKGMSEKNQDVEMRLLVQILRGPSNAFQPLSSKHDFDRELKTDEPPADALVLNLMEVRQKSSERRKDFDGVPVGEVYCVLQVLDTRAGPPR